jgi:hypothetical protein
MYATGAVALRPLAVNVHGVRSIARIGLAGAGRAEPCDLVRISKLVNRIAVLAMRQPPDFLYPLESQSWQARHSKAVRN